MNAIPDLCRSKLRRICHVTMAIAFAFCCSDSKSASAGFITTYFDSSQTETDVASGMTSDTISSNGYLFTFTRDKLFTGNLGPSPIGRTVRVPWPQGVEAQAVTTQPPGTTNPDYKARITISRVDGDVFDLTAFTAKLLANTAGAGGSIEIMPQLNGEDGFNDPVFFNATGYYSQSFSYNTSPSYLGSTALLKGFDTYRIGLYVDFALTGLTLDGAALPDTGNPGAGPVTGTGTATVTPEPTSLVLAALAGLGLALTRRRRVAGNNAHCAAPEKPQCRE
jgi:hypothetical protein